MAGLPYHPYRRQALAAAVATWLLFVWLILVVDPSFVADVGWEYSYLPLLLLVLASVGLTLWGITGRWKRTGLWTLIIVVSLWLRINQLDSIVNLILLFSFGAVWEYYWRLSKVRNLIN